MTTEISTPPARGLALQSMADAMTFGKMVADSEFAPKDFRGKPASCVLAIQAGAEIGLAPLQSLQSIAVINGRPSIWGDSALALVMASPSCEYVKESVDGDGEAMVATCVAKRRGFPEPTTVKFSMADAKRAGLAGKPGPWSQYPRRMLQLRARGFALRDAFPDVLRGLVTAEEAQDYTPDPVRETPRPPVEVRPKFDPPALAAPQESPAGKAKVAISLAKTLDDLDKLRRLIDQRLSDGTFSQSEHDELVTICTHRAEMLIGAEEVAA